MEVEFQYDKDGLAEMLKIFQGLLDMEYGKGEKDARVILDNYRPVVEILLEDRGELMADNRKMKMCYARDGMIIAALTGSLNGVLALVLPSEVFLSITPAIRELARVFWTLGYASASSYGIEDWENPPHLDDDEGPYADVSDEELESLWGDDKDE